MRRLNLPSLDLTTFKGDAASFRPFMQTFDSNIARNLDSEAEKLLYLLKFTKGKPHDIVQTCVHLPEELGYAQAVKLLSRRYDSQVQTVASLVDKILSLPALRSDDGEGLDDFGIYLRGCANALETLPDGLASVDAKVICKILDKVPYHMVERWRRRADSIEQEEKRSANFRDLVEFIEKEARIATNSSYGRQAFVERVRKHDDKRSTQAPRRVVTGKTMTGSVRPMETVAACLFCDGKHKTEACQKLEQKPQEEQIKFVREKGLCFACLMPGHRSRFCKERKTCGKCGKRHPTVLHEDRAVVPTVTTGHAAPIQIGGSKLQIVRVRVTFGYSKVTTNAFLDSGSTHSFIARSLMNKLQMKRQKTTPLKVSTITREESLASSLVPGLLIEDIDGENVMELPPLYFLEHIPVVAEDVPSQEDVERWSYLQDAGVSLKSLKDGEEIGLLIGGNSASVMEPLEICPSQKGGPYAVRTRYGWVLGGARRQTHTIRVNRISIIEELDLDEQLCNRADMRRGLSVEDVRWCVQMDTGCKRRDDRYEIRLPFREEPRLDDNRQVALQRLDLLKRNFERNPEYAKEYKAIMADLLEMGYVEEAPATTGKWYLPHFGVRSPQKEKVRVVFDCASRYHGMSLNDTLLQGPDLTNPLIDVLVRFREQPYAFTGDIEAMFLQVLVPEPQRDYLRFLWWPQGDVTRQPKEYRNTRHLFGATSSPSCANLALHKTAEDFGHEMEEARKTIRHNFYVDDVLKSVESEEAAVELLNDLKYLCAKGGFKLTKISSNSIQVLKSVPQEERAKNVKDLSLGTEALPVERALGVLWNTRSDNLGFQVDIEKLMKKPVTKRGMLSAMASCYDPLGLVAPCIVSARILIQDLFRLKVNWDDRVPDSTMEAWERWLRELTHLSSCSIPRCLSKGGLVVATELHHFSDASERAYGVVSYLRSVMVNGVVHCALLMSKARLAPVKALTIPRLELAAATLAVKSSVALLRALDVKPVVHFWTDSSTVLKYIRNEKTRYNVFVANRLAVIHDGSLVQQWHYVPSETNPADLVSRGMHASSLIHNNIWQNGPMFLQDRDAQWPAAPEHKEDSDADPEVRTTALTSAVVQEVTPIEKLARHYSDWRRLIRAVALLRLVISEWKARGTRQTPRCSRRLTLMDLEAAERCILIDVQSRHFRSEISELKAGRPVGVSSPLRRLDPWLDEGVLRVGGRLSMSTLPFDSKFPRILPKQDPVVDLLINAAHEKAGHQGRQHVLADLRASFWILGANAAVRRCISRCTKCRKLLRRPEIQKMANLPVERLEVGEKAFTNTGVDYFGPFYVKHGRSLTKKYGVVFTCLAIRAVHIEFADSLTTDSFICALRRFVARRGTVRSLLSDQGTNFTGAEKELRRELADMKKRESEVQDAALRLGIDWQWRFHPPYASHFGGVWERHIRTIRKILNSLLAQQTFSLETLQTLLCEIEAIINNRPLTPVSSDAYDQPPLTPNHLLLLQSVVFPPSSTVWDHRKSWKQAGYLADQFWRRWRAEYLPLLQERAAPTTRSRANVKKGDVVLIVDDSVPRGVWPLGRVEEAFQSADGRVRSVRVRARGTTYDRPITKVVKIIDA